VVSLSKPVASRGRVLLTGAKGFTGAYMRAELEAAGYEVMGAVAAMPAGPREVKLDITSLDDCRRAMDIARPDYLVHLAATSFVHHPEPETFYRVNVIGTLNLLQALADLEIAPRRVLIASSANVYGNTTAGMITETQPPQPINHYAVSKLAMEYMVRTWCDRFPIVVTRPFNYTGVGQDAHFLVPKIVAHFMRQAPVIELGNLEVGRDFSDVRMVAHVYRRLLECECAGETVNVCSAQPYSLRDILALMEKICAHRIEVRINPAFVRQSEVKTLVGSPDKLHRLLGDFDIIALEKTLHWMTQA